MQNLTEEFAEFVGVLVGDGYLDKDRGRVIISGNLEKDSNYLNVYVKPLIETLFQIKCLQWKQKSKNCFYLAFYSKNIIGKLVSMGIKKTEIPDFILQCNYAVKSAFLRGMSDTDFCIYFQKGSSRKLHSYPMICSTFSSEKLVLQLVSILSEFGINANIYPRVSRHKTKSYRQWNIQIFGKKNLDFWTKEIGFRNDRILNRIALWKRQGYCNPGPVRF